MAKVALLYRAAVDESAIEDIVDAADLPSGRIGLIVGDKTIEPEYQGLSIPRRFASGLGNLYGLEEFLDEPWDCGVLIALRWAARQAEFPAYFAYVLGHELGHATTALTNLSHVAFEELILRFVPRIVNDREWRWDDMPHEVRYDQFGMAIAEELFGPAHVETEFSRLIEARLSEDEERLHGVLTLPPRKDLDGIVEELAEFSLPHREVLLRMWTAERRNGRLKYADGIADLSALWSAI